MVMKLEDVLSSVGKKMVIDFEEITKEIEHKGLKGSIREIMVRNFLDKYLPKSLGIGHGEIVSSAGQVSKEQDIVVYDKFKCPILYQEGEIQVFVIEGVYAVIEVKSFLDSNELIKSIDNIRSVKEMPKVAYLPQGGAIVHTVNLYGREFEYFPTMGFIFAYDSIDLKELMSALEKINIERNLNIDQRIDMIFILKKGIMLNYNPDKDEYSATPEPNSKLACSDTTQNLLLFYLLSMNILTQVWTRPIKLTSYAKVNAPVFRFQQKEES